MSQIYRRGCSTRLRLNTSWRNNIDWISTQNDNWLYEPTCTTCFKTFSTQQPQRLLHKSSLKTPVRIVHASQAVRIPTTVAVPLSLKDKIMQVCSATALSFANGAFMGGIFGLVQGGLSSKSFGGAWKEAALSGRTWGGISAIYACLQSASKVVRGRDDKYNNVVGACGSGAFFSWNNGFRAALQGCISFALFSYLIDMFLSPRTTPLEKRTSDGAWNNFTN
jgi:hypothetical protein